MKYTIAINRIVKLEIVLLLIDCNKIDKQILLSKTCRYYCSRVPSRCSGQSYLSPTRWSPRRWQRLWGSKTCPMWPKKSNPKEDFWWEFCKNCSGDIFHSFHWEWNIFTYLSTFPSSHAVTSFIFWSAKFKDAVNRATKTEYYILFLIRLIKAIIVIERFLKDSKLLWKRKVRKVFFSEGI